MSVRAKKILLIGHDPVFAWALQQRVNSIGWNVEHVFTLTEARLRAARFRYDVFLLDGLNDRELAKFPLEQGQSSNIFVLEDAVSNRSFEPDRPSTHYLSKENALNILIADLQSLP
jgi:hypothetical protein